MTQTGQGGASRADAQFDVDSMSLADIKAGYALVLDVHETSVRRSGFDPARSAFADLFGYYPTLTTIVRVLATAREDAGR